MPLEGDSGMLVPLAAAQALIVRAKGQPHVAPDSDPRPAMVLTPVADDFSSADDFI